MILQKLVADESVSMSMSFADACLVRMSEQIGNSAVMTLDSNFKIYRKYRNEEILVIQP